MNKSNKFSSPIFDGLIFDGLIFDFNGVLFWDDHLQRQSWREFTKKFRSRPLTDEEINIHVHGRNGKYTLEYLVGHAISQAEADDWMEQKESIYREMCLCLDGEFRLSPGAIDLLDGLVENQIPCTIATASAQGNLNFFIEHLELANWFDLEKIAYDNGQIAGKPAPDLYLAAAEYLNLSPGKCVVIEDSLSGIQAAHAAGIGHIIALGPESTHKQLAQQNGVNQIIENLSQVQIASLFNHE